MNLFPKNILPTKEVKKFIVIFYIVGIFGFIIPITRELFITITPYALLLSTYLLAVYHENYSKKTIILFSIIAFSGYVIEAIGVNTGAIFGQYVYGSALGFKLYETPLLIAVNWLFLTYTASSVSNKISNKWWLQLFLAPTLMLMYDIILEQLAPRMDMWSWLYSSVPLQNYISWWIIGFLFTLLIKALKIETKNPLSFVLYVSQFLFFAVLYFVFIIIS